MLVGKGDGKDFSLLCLQEHTVDDVKQKCDTWMPFVNISEGSGEAG